MNISALYLVVMVLVESNLLWFFLSLKPTPCLRTKVRDGSFASAKYFQCASVVNSEHAYLAVTYKMNYTRSNIC